MEGVLYIVATPIGNLEDITLRALKVLKSVDIIACEDTRRTRILLDHYNIKKKLMSFYSYNQFKQIDTIITELKSGRNIALVSDSGTPGISDPGQILVKKVIAENLKVESIPGPSALISALVCSGLPTDKFIFLGFLPRKKGRMKKILEDIKHLNKTVIIYESPFRVLETLNICSEIFGTETDCVIARELTKIYEEFIRGKIIDVIRKISLNKIKGEIIILLYPQKKGENNGREGTENFNETF